MAVPGRRNGLNEEDDEESNGLFGEEGLVAEESDTPPHLRDLSHAATHGDLNALRLAIGTLSLSLTHNCSSLLIQYLPLSVKPYSTSKQYQSKNPNYYLLCCAGVRNGVRNS